MNSKISTNSVRGPSQITTQIHLAQPWARAALNRSVVVTDDDVFMMSLSSIVKGVADACLSLRLMRLPAATLSAHRGSMPLPL